MKSKNKYLPQEIIEIFNAIVFLTGKNLTIMQTYTDAYYICYNGKRITPITSCVDYMTKIEYICYKTDVINDTIEYWYLY